MADPCNGANHRWHKTRSVWLLLVIIRMLEWSQAPYSPSEIALDFGVGLVPSCFVASQLMTLELRVPRNDIV